MQQLNDQQLEKLKAEVFEAVMAEVKKRAISRVLKENEDRINQFIAEADNDLSKAIKKELPL